VVADQVGGWLVGWMYSLVSLLLGWWGLPWGLIWTPTVVYRNLRGGHATTAGALLTSITAKAGAAAAAKA